MWSPTPFKFCNYTTVSIFTKGGGLSAGNTSSLAAHWLTASPAKPGLAEVTVTRAKPRPNQLRFTTPDRPASARFLTNIKRLWNRPLSDQPSLISRSHARKTYSIVWEQPGVIVQYEPAVLPPLHDVSPFAQRPLHDGRHFYTLPECSRGGARGEKKHASDVTCHALYKDDFWLWSNNFNLTYVQDDMVKVKENEIQLG